MTSEADGVNWLADGAPLKAVADFLAFVDEGDFDSAWALLGERARTRLDPIAMMGSRVLSVYRQALARTLDWSVTDMKFLGGPNRVGLALVDDSSVPKDATLGQVVELASSVLPIHLHLTGATWLIYDLGHHALETP